MKHYTVYNADNACLNYGLSLTHAYCVSIYASVQISFPCLVMLKDWYIKPIRRYSILITVHITGQLSVHLYFYQCTVKILTITILVDTRAINHYSLAYSIVVSAHPDHADFCCCVYVRRSSSNLRTPIGFSRAVPSFLQQVMPAPIKFLNILENDLNINSMKKLKQYKNTHSFICTKNFQNMHLRRWYLTGNFTAILLISVLLPAVSYIWCGRHVKQKFLVCNYWA